MSHPPVTRLSLVTILTAQSLSALTIQIDYSLDTNGFFDLPERRVAMEAVADRWSAIITQELLEVATADNSRDDRIGFIHPGTGASYQISSAAGPESDALVRAGASPANEYRNGISIPADTILIFAGGRSISSAGLGGTGTGANFTSVFSDPNSVLNRGFNVGSGSQPVWGGTVTFDIRRNWNFALEEPFDSGTDFYTIAIHEVGHVLGLAVNFNDFQALVSNGSFMGENAAAGVTGGAPGGLRLEDGTAATEPNGLGGVVNPHWEDGTYQSPIFAAGNPNYAGTVGEGNPQDLAMEPIANFTNRVRRIEVTRAEVGALQDMGYDVVSEFEETPLDLWRAEFFQTATSLQDSANGFDFDNDGLANLLEYALGTNPTVGNFNSIAGMETRDDRLAISFSFDPNAAGINLIVEVGDDLQSWEPIAETGGTPEFRVVESGTRIEMEAGSVTVISPNSMGASSREFARLRVVELAPPSGS